MNKKDCLFTPTHEWAYIEGDIAYIGLSSYAVSHLGDIVFIDLPEVNKTFNKGDVFGAIESVKSASDLYIPLSGVVIEVNEALSDSPQLINEDPFGTYVIKIKLSNKNEKDELLNVDDYEKTLE